MLAAILVATGIVGTAVYLHTVSVTAQAEREEARKVKLDSDIMREQRLWREAMSRDSNFDPDAKKLSDRLFDIREASERGRTVPPSPFLQQSNATPIPESPLGFVTLTQPADVKVPYGTVRLNSGTRLRVVRRQGADMVLLYEGQTVQVPASWTR